MGITMGERMFLWDLIHRKNRDIDELRAELGLPSLSGDARPATVLKLIPGGKSSGTSVP